MNTKYPFSEEDWQATSKSVQDYVIHQDETIRELKRMVIELTQRIEKLENQLNKNSKNSNKPPSSDPPYKKPSFEFKQEKGKKRKRGGQKGHVGHQQILLSPNSREIIMPSLCVCGCSRFKTHDFKPFYTHQVIELPMIEVDITHFVLHKGPCPECGRTVKAKVPNENRTGYGPRLTAAIAELSGTYGCSREMIKDVCQNILGFHISTGAIQKVIDRSSKALLPAYNWIGDEARRAAVNYIDETAWFQRGLLRWLWAMVNAKSAYFKIHQNRNMAAFKEIIDDWNGILVSDGYGVYKKWAGPRQTCLAHLIREAENLAERKDESIRRFGKNILAVLRQLVSFSHKPPSQKKWTDCYSRLIMFILLFEGADDDAGKLARRLSREMDQLFTFLEEENVDPTNNRAERAIRFGVLWRKRSMGTQSDKGNRWVERILSLKQTCRLKGIPSFHILYHLVDSYFKEQKPCLVCLA